MKPLTSDLLMLISVKVVFNELFNLGNLYAIHYQEWNSGSNVHASLLVFQSLLNSFTDGAESLDTRPVF